MGPMESYSRRDVLRLLLALVPSVGIVAGGVALIAWYVSSPRKHASDQRDLAAMLGQRRVDMGHSVPSNFDGASDWNRKSICPDGAKLSAVMKYQANGEQEREGYSYYFGRSCREVYRRGPASDPDAETTIVPDGPFVFWWPNGRVMMEGRFVEGMPVGEWTNRDPSGNPIFHVEPGPFLPYTDFTAPETPGGGSGDR